MTSRARLRTRARQARGAFRSLLRCGYCCSSTKHAPAAAGATSCSAAPGSIRSRRPTFASGRSERGQPGGIAAGAPRMPGCVPFGLRPRRELGSARTNCRRVCKIERRRDRWLSIAVARSPEELLDCARAPDAGLLVDRLVAVARARFCAEQASERIPQIAAVRAHAPE